ncbi:MAG: EAL domain-containing protein [Pseudoxanthomonas sp.]
MALQSQAYERPPGRARIRPARAAALFGLVVGLGLLGLLVFWLASERLMRLQAAQRQAVATAAGAAVLVEQDLRHVDAALRAVASNTRRAQELAPEQLTVLVDGYAAGVLERNPQIADITLLDAAGAPLTHMDTAAATPLWTPPSFPADTVALGDMQTDGRAGWLLPLALPLVAADGRRHWLLARLRCSHLHDLLSALDAEHGGGAIVLTRRPGDQLIASNVSPRVEPGQRLGMPASAAGQAPLRSRQIDSVDRLVVGRELQRYPLLLWAGLSMQSILAPWYRALGVATVVMVLYVLALTVLLFGLYRAEQQQAHLLDRLNRNIETLRRAQRAGMVTAWTMDAQGQGLEWDSDADGLFGIGGPDGQSLRSVVRHVAVENRAQVIRRFAEAWRGGGVFSAEFRLQGDDGASRWVAARGGMVEGGDGRRRMTGTLVDITERVRAQSRVSDAERQFRQVFDRNPLPFWVVAADSLALLEFNQAVLARYGFSRTEMAGMSLPDLHAGDDRAALRELMAHPDFGPEGARVWSQRRRDGSVLQVRMHVGQLAFDGRDARLVMAEDVTERLEQERELAYRARYDQTTGLLNLQVLAEALDSGQYPGYQVIYLQLTSLQALRDSLGREAAEVVLRTLAERLQHWSTRFGLAAHQPADDFVLAVLDPRHTEAALEAVLAAVREPLGDGSMQSLGARLGVAEDEAGSLRAEQVVDNAALAAHALHAAAGPAVSRFDGALARSYGERLRLAAHLRTAVERCEEFELLFQPIVRTSDARMVALEALLRWSQRDGSQIPPARFIPLCEDTGLILPLGEWVLQRAARAQAQLRARGLDVPVAVNVSALQMLHGDLPATVAAACKAAGVAPAMLHLELTESVLMQRPEQALATMAQLRGMGVGLSLDDFGTGFSSMAYLRHMPLNVVKIDRAFVSGVDTDARNAAICRTMLQLARSLGLVCIGEGVETQAELDWLRSNGCEQVQGYLLGRPQTLAALGV